MLLAGCTFEGKVTQAPALMECRDSRDGETFRVRGNTIRNVRMGIGADSCFDATDTSGHDRTMCKSHEVFLKCNEVRP